MGRGVWPLAGPTVLFFLRKDKERGGGGRGQMGACSLAGGGRVDRLAHRFVFCCVFFHLLRRRAGIVVCTTHRTTLIENTIKSTQIYP